VFASTWQSSMVFRKYQEKTLGSQSRIMKRHLASNDDRQVEMESKVLKMLVLLVPGFQETFDPGRKPRN